MSSTPADRLAEVLAAVETFCESRVPDDLRDEIRVECSRRGKSITIVERRPPWKAEPANLEWTSSRIAQLRYDDASSAWTLYCPDASGRWWLYDRVAPSSSIDPLLAEIDEDPTGIFWG
jgi:hypothetical protein